MRILYIAAGAAGSYCGACARDVTVVRGLRARGHDAVLIPLYTPLRTDGSDPSFPRVFYSGINAYLQQHFALFRRTSPLLDRLLDLPALLRLLSRFAIETRPEELGEMTVSVLKGKDGCQRKELEKFLAFLSTQPRPDLVNLTNSLLISLAPHLKEQLDAPVVCGLQGEEAFVERLGEPHRSQALHLIRQHAQCVDRFIASHERYADEMVSSLGVPRERIRVIRPGVDLATYTLAKGRPRRPFRIGFLSRISPAKGLDILVEAFRLMGSPDAMLCIAGQLPRGNRAFWKEIESRLSAAYLRERVECVGELDLQKKLAFLRGCSVYSLPSRVQERRGMACLEAMAVGCPAVVPETGIFPEIISLTGGGVLVPPEDPKALAEALATLYDDAHLADRLGAAAAAGIAEYFNAEKMVSETVAIYEELIERFGSRDRRQRVS